MNNKIKYFYLEDGLEIADAMVIYNGFSKYDDIMFYYDNAQCNEKIRIALPEYYNKIVSESRSFDDFLDSFKGAGSHTTSHGIEIDTCDCVNALIEKIKNGDEYIVNKLDECFTVYSPQLIGDKKNLHSVAWELMSEQFDAILRVIIKDLIGDIGVKPQWLD